ncbi:hypothetical protein [Microvirga massiliensis]|uniref:hypothetical protein n=1 Tax=Microvirga massiliensis TaxID=1033741 RepID=UPI00062B6BF1|nr:hypothetical protein [Microvirga massiliensis]
MARSATGDRSQSQPVATTGVQSSSPRRSAQVEAQDRIIAGLRAMWADLLARPVPAHLLHLVREFERKGADNDC